MFILGSLESAYRLPISNSGTFSLGVTAEALRAKIDGKSAISLQRDSAINEGYIAHLSLRMRETDGRIYFHSR